MSKTFGDWLRSFGRDFTDFGFVFVKRICACEYDLCLWEICFFLKYKVFLHVQKIYLQAQIFITSTKLCYRDKTDFHAETHLFFTSTKLCYRDMTVFHTRTHCFYKHKIFPRVHKFFSQAQNISTCTQILFMSTRYFYEYRRSGREFIP